MPEVLPDYDIACGHINPDLDDDTDAWLVAFDLTTVSINSPDDNSTSDFIIYPNPANDIITIKNTKSDIDAVSVSMYNIIGQQIFNAAYFVDEEIHIDSRTMQEGCYIITISNSENILFNASVIIQH